MSSSRQADLMRELHDEHATALWACSGASSSPWRGPSPSGSSRSALWTPGPARGGSSQTALRARRAGRRAVQARGPGRSRGDDEWPSLAKSSWAHDFLPMVVPPGDQEPPSPSGDESS